MAQMGFSIIQTVVRTWIRSMILSSKYTLSHPGHSAGLLSGYALAYPNSCIAQRFLIKFGGGRDKTVK